MKSSQDKVRYAVVGLGNIAQMAVLPAFEHANENSELVALVSSDREKLDELGRTYRVAHRGSYDDLERIFHLADVDAAYIALPNALHRSFFERCARAGVHVLCEKPMAPTEEDAEAMVEAAREAGIKSMVAYRLHFEEANLRAIEIAQSGVLGELRYFSSTFSQQVREGDIRTRADMAGGALFDLGIYCVNAARYLFRDEPEAVLAFRSKGHDARFDGVDETTTAILRFPGDRLAQLTCSQGAADVDSYRLVGTKGDLVVEPAFTYYGDIVHHLTVDGRTRTVKFGKRDQFAPELVHFSQCILEDREPEPSAEEGLCDVRVLSAIAESCDAGELVMLPRMTRSQRPSMALEMHKRPVHQPKVVHAPSPSK